MSYKSQRAHSTLGYISPTEYEEILTKLENIS